MFTLKILDDLTLGVCWALGTGGKLFLFKATDLHLALRIGDVPFARIVSQLAPFAGMLVKRGARLTVRPATANVEDISCKVLVCAFHWVILTW